MYKKLFFLFLLFFAGAIAQQLNSSQLEPLSTGQTLNQTYKSFFIQNKGQWNPEVKYLARTGGMNAWITSSGVVYDYYKVNKNYDQSKTLKMNPKEKRDYENKNTFINGHVVKMQFVNSKNNVAEAGTNQKEGYYNYFIGNDQSKWATYVPIYDNVEVPGVYKNIDVKYYFDNGMLRYDYKAKPGADVSQIKFKFYGQTGISINANGELVLKTSIGDVTNGEIYAYQKVGDTQKKVPCQFEQREDGSIGLKANNYDIRKELIIDPLVYSTYIGGSNNDAGSSVALDAGGNAYVTGAVESSNFPVTTGAYQDSLNGTQNVFVTKLNPTGSALIYSTIIGGMLSDAGSSIAVDGAGNAYITGYSESTNYPVTAGAYQTTLGSTAGNVFVTKLNPTGSALVYSTFVGGEVVDWGNSICLDDAGNAYITGVAESPDYPTTSGAFQTTLIGFENAFVTKLNSTGSALIYSTLLGGSCCAGGLSIAVDAAGYAFITGPAKASGFPVTKGAYQDSLKGIQNAFITKLNSTGSALVYSTFIGGNFYDVGLSIAIDKNEDAYITGWTESSDYPTTNGAYQATLRGIQNAIVTKLNSTGSALIYSTIIGGSGYQGGESIVLDAGGNAYIAGEAISPSGYPVTSGAFQAAMGDTNAADAFVTKLNPSGSALIYSTFIGGNSWDVGFSIAINANEDIYLTGSTESSNYPVTSGVLQTVLNGTKNAFLTKLNLSTAEFVRPNNPTAPDKFELMQNFPNPFNPSTTINYSVPKTSLVKIKVYDILGKEITTLVNEEKSAGNYSVQFIGGNLSSGIYFYRMQAGNFVGTQKLILLK
jgi:hypothetical protein